MAANDSVEWQCHPWLATPASKSAWSHAKRWLMYPPFECPVTWIPVKSGGLRSIDNVRPHGCAPWIHVTDPIFTEWIRLRLAEGDTVYAVIAMAVIP